jgi:hypothetical protein
VVGVARARALAAAALADAQLALLQAVERRNFIGQRAQRCHLHIAVMRNLRHLLVVFAEIFAVLPNLVEALRLQQHAGVGAGQPDDGERTHQRRGYKSVRVVQAGAGSCESAHLHPGQQKECNSACVACSPFIPAKTSQGRNSPCT